MAEILVVEDDAWVRELMCDVLRGSGHQVREAGNGAEALAALAGRPLPDAISLDLEMPVMDGWTFLAEVASDPRAARIPVLVVSAADPRRRPLPPAAAVLRKPMHLDDLLAAIARALASGAEPRASV